jgi:hypothetical protein
VTEIVQLFISVLGLELRASHLSHTSSPAGILKKTVGTKKIGHEGGFQGR